MKRSTFKRPQLERKRSVPVAMGEVRGTYAPVGDVVVAMPKGVVAKPGKRPPTKEEAAWMDWIVSFGCVACWIDGVAPRPTAVHHILRGGRRMGHLFSLPLCDPGHHQGGEAFGLVSRHPWRARFEERYGSELSLLQMLQQQRDGVWRQ